MDSDKTLTGARVLVLAREGASLGSEGEFSALLDGIGCRNAGVASSASEALGLVNDLATRPDLLVVDLGSSSETFDVCALARQLGDVFGTASVIAMARSDIGRMNEAISALPSGYLNKPFSQTELKETLLKALPDRKPVEVPMNVPSASSTAVPPEKNGPQTIQLGAGAVGAAGVALASAGLRSPANAVKATTTETIQDSLKSLMAEAKQEQGAKVETLPSPLASPPLSKFAGAIPAALPAPPPAEDPNAHKLAARGQQLQGLGYLGRGFAHEFNNLLTVLIGNLSLAQDRYESGVAGAGGEVDDESELSAALGAAERGRRMVQQLLTFAEGGQPVRDVVRIADLARTVLGNHREPHPSVFFQFQCSEPDLKISVDRDQVSRLLENLVTNAVQALPVGGTVIVRLQTTTDAKVDGGQSGLEYLLMEVIDTGIGMDEDTLKHAFDPYFTTRGDTNATGIGLTVCESIAKSHGGFLVLQSKSGRGTIATFHLPMNAATARPDIFQLLDNQPQSEAKVDAAPHTVDSPKADIETVSKPEGIPGLFDASVPDFSSASPLSAKQVVSEADDRANEFGMLDEGDGRRVLVMEDDAMIRRLVVRCLGRAGYDVVETTNGQDALDMHAMADAEGRRFDLILSDLTIEDGMGGIEMMQLLRQRDDKIRAVVSSGYADSPAMARPAEYGFDAVLPKPYPPRELLRSVAETLAGGEMRGR